MKKKRIIKMLAIALALPLLGASIYMVNLKARQASAGYPCYGPNVVYCGANSKQDLVNMINGSDQAGHGDIKSIYDGIGIYSNDILSSRMADGYIRKSDGAIVVNGQVVAMDTVDGQRGTYGIQGASTAWDGLYWARPISNFAASQLDVWVYMPNGQFKYAIIKECGNPVLVPPLHALPPSITLQKQVINLTGDKVLTKSDTANPGDELGYLLTIKNVSDVTVKDVVVSDILPPHVTLVPGTGQLRYGSTDTDVPDAGITQGYDIGDFPPGQIASIRFTVKVKDKNDFPGGCSNLINTGFARGSQTAKVEDTASTQVCVIIPQAKYNITVRKFNDLNGDGKKEDNEPFLQGWTFTLKGNDIEDTRTTDATGSIQYINLNPGSYTVTETMQPGWRSTTGTAQTVIIGPDKTIMFGNQQIPVPPTTVPPTTPTPPGVTQLPTAGPADAAAGAVGTLGLGYVGYIWRKSKQTLKKSFRK